MHRAVLRRPRRASRRFAIRRVAAKVPQIGTLPAHMNGKRSTKRRVSICVTPRSSTCKDGMHKEHEMEEAYWK